MDITSSKIFSQLTQACVALSQIKINDLFNIDAMRFTNFSRSFDQLTIDFSKQKINQEVFDLLVKLAQEANLMPAIHSLHQGEIVNYSEQRPAKHMHLRATMPSAEIAHERHKMQQFVASNKFSTIIHLGIGGSDLGPQMVIQALQPFAKPNAPKIHFISNTDADHLHAILKDLNPQECLCIISSKSFTTLETLTLANKVFAWYQQAQIQDIAQHVIAITANPQKAHEFGIAADKIFQFWDFVGGRYSVWSAIGLPIALTIGYEQFMEFLQGAHALDQHFVSAPLTENLPVILGLLGVLNINFYNYHTHCVIPYTDALGMLPDYLQQLEMESNGKQAKVNTAPIVWGSVGCNGQHAFMQLLHQGSVIAPVDFILPLRSHYHDSELQNVLISSCLAQASALLTGTNTIEGEKHCPGDKPSTLILCPQLTPYTLGQLLALYEHKVFTQAVLWGINPFDQWGVQLGKVINEQLLAIIKDARFSQAALSQLDPSTQGLLHLIYKKES